MIPSFQIVTPFMHGGELYTNGLETKLLSKDFTEEDFVVLLEIGAIVPNQTGMRWYEGPHCNILWASGLYTEQDVRTKVVKGKRKIKGLTIAKLREVAGHFGVTLQEAPKKSKAKPIKKDG